ncbi:MAG: DUF2917 domain-containing protein [Burkholderiales bacterium]|nr:DUF2917 domain-containing protein [Burkholderiales bacterium]
MQTIDTARHPGPDFLAHRNMVRVRSSAGRRVTCVRGCLWITHDNDPQETVLAPGESCVGALGNDMVVYALEPSEVAWS